MLARARAIYLGDEGERWEDLLPQVGPHVDYVVGVIEQLATPGGTADAGLDEESSP